MNAWRHALEAILDAPGVVVMLGAVDVGKTTLATAIASAAVRARRRTAIVDADTGQSDIGPPTTIGLAIPRIPARRMDQWAAIAVYFAGDTSPQPVYCHVVEGTMRSVERARARRSEVIVVDTTGWIAGDAGIAAKVHKLHRIDPEYVVALQRRDELDPILERLDRRITIHLLRPSSRVRRRSREVRQAARARRFRQYFAHARPHTLALGTLSSVRPPVYRGAEIPSDRMLVDIPARELNHLLVGLADRGGWLKALGCVVETAPRQQAVTVMTPLRVLTGVDALQWGVLRVAPSGVEEGRLG